MSLESTSVDSHLAKYLDFFESLAAGHGEASLHVIN